MEENKAYSSWWATKVDVGKGERDWRKLGLEMVLGYVMWCGRRRRWAHFCIIALHLQGSHHKLGQDGGVRSKHVVFSLSHIEECTCTNTSARQTKYLSTVCRKLYQRVMCYERQLDVLGLQGLVLGVFRLVLSGIWSPASSYTLNMITGNYVASSIRAQSSDFNSLL